MKKFIDDIRNVGCDIKEGLVWLVLLICVIYEYVLFLSKCRLAIVKPVKKVP